ncbi:MAG TPA: hypothetical protein VMH47_06025 [Gaiellaceae bacterium]|nr:hypothetical protein [Gaiellaceae bacterium]
MRRHRLDLIVLLVLVSGACAFLSLALPGDRSLFVHIYVLVVGGLAMAAVIGAVAAAVPHRRRSELRAALDEPAPEAVTVSELAKLEREVTLSVGNAYDLHVRLLPQLRDIAEARLERTGKRPGPDTLGRWWDLLRPDRPEPADRFARGIRPDELGALVAYLQSL